MAVAALKRKPASEPEPQVKTYHATMLVTRAEEWCVEAGSAEEARELLAQGLGHRCRPARGCSPKLRASRARRLGVRRAHR
jgi:hypothetical protein